GLLPHGVRGRRVCWIRRSTEKSQRACSDIQECRGLRIRGALARRARCVRAGEVMSLPHLDGDCSGMKELVGVRRQFDAPVGRRELHQISALEAHLLRRLGGHLHPGVPRHLCHWIRSLLKPGLVGVSSVKESIRWIHDERMRTVTIELEGLLRNARAVLSQGGWSRRGLAPYSSALLRFFLELGEGR